MKGNRGALLYGDATVMPKASRAFRTHPIGFAEHYLKFGSWQGTRSIGVLHRHSARGVRAAARGLSAIANGCISSAPDMLDCAEGLFLEITGALLFST